VKILLVEDDLETAAYIARGLSEIGHSVDHSASGREGLVRAVGEKYDVMVLDRLLPEVDGMAILRATRAAGIGTPVLLLSALNGISDRVRGLEAGSDDYLVKPFAFTELAARVAALGRRPPPQEIPASSLKHGGLEMDIEERRVTRDGTRIELQPREFRLLEVLLRHAGRLVTRTMLLEQVWGFHFDPKTNIVETHISRLRSKVDRGFTRPLIHTVRGAGYSLEDRT